MAHGYALDLGATKIYYCMMIKYIVQVYLLGYTVSCSPDSLCRLPLKGSTCLDND